MKTLAKVTFFLAALFVVCAVQAAAPESANLASRIEALRQTVRSETESLIHGAQSLSAAELRGIAESRERAMAALIQASPDDALQAAFSPAQREQLPAEVQGHIEEPATRTGTLEVLGVLADDGRPGLEHRLITEDGDLRLAINLPDDYLSGTQLTVQGLLLGEWLVGNAKDAIVLRAVTAPEINTTLATRYALVISVNFSDNPAQPWTMDLAQERFNGVNGVGNWFTETSYGQMTIASEVAGWFTIAAPSTVCSPNTFRDQAEAAARAAGYEPSNYNHIVVAFPRVASCGWAGLGQVPGRYVWLNNTINRAPAVHELGHNLGLLHSHSQRCSDDPLRGTCSSLEYGDIFDAMGSGGAEYHASFRTYLGWIPTSDVMSVGALDGDVTAVLQSAETGNGTRVLQIQRLTGDYLFVEAREAIGFDSILTQYPLLFSGVTVYRGPSFRTQYLVDIVFTTTTRTDAPLQFGDTLYDVDGDLSISPLYTVDGYTYVNVHFGLGASIR